MLLPLLLLLCALKLARRTPKGTVVVFQGHLVVSNLASWMQATITGFAVLEVTGSPQSLGLSVALGSAPRAILGLWGGVIADHFPRRKTILVTQSLMLAQSGLLGLLLALHAANEWNLYAFMALSGVLLAINQPAQTGIFREMLRAWDEKAGAKAMSFYVRGSVVGWLVGSSAAGFCSSSKAWGWVCLMNVLSFIPVIQSVRRSEFGRSRPIEHDERITLSFLVKRITSLIEAAKHLQAEAGRELLQFTLATLFLGSFSVTLPVIAEHLGGDSRTFSVLYLAQGAGAFLACTSLVQKRFPPGSGWLLYCLASVLYGLVFPLWWEAAIVLCLSFIAEVVAIRTKQSLCASGPEKLVGRFSAIYSLIFTGGGGLSGLIAGLLISRVGLYATIEGMSACFVLTLIAIKAFAVLRVRRE